MQNTQRKIRTELLIVLGGRRERCSEPARIIDLETLRVAAGRQGRNRKGYSLRLFVFRNSANKVEPLLSGPFQLRGEANGMAEAAGVLAAEAVTPVLQEALGSVARGKELALLASRFLFRGITDCWPAGAEDARAAMLGLRDELDVVETRLRVALAEDEQLRACLAGLDAAHDSAQALLAEARAEGAWLRQELDAVYRHVNMKQIQKHTHTHTRARAHTHTYRHTHTHTLKQQVRLHRGTAHSMGLVSKLERVFGAVRSTPGIVFSSSFARGNTRDTEVSKGEAENADYVTAYVKDSDFEGFILDVIPEQNHHRAMQNHHRAVRAGPPAFASSVETARNLGTTEATQNEAASDGRGNVVMASSRSHSLLLPTSVAQLFQPPLEESDVPESELVVREDLSHMASRNTTVSNPHQELQHFQPPHLLHLPGAGREGGRGGVGVRGVGTHVPFNVL